MAKPSPAQKIALNRCWQNGRFTPYMPYADEARSWDACVRHGWMIYRQRDLKRGIQQNGYQLTEQGMKLIGVSYSV